MKTKLLLALLGSTASLVCAEELQRLTGDELTKATQLLVEAGARLESQPLKLELALDQAMGFKGGEVGALLIPDKRFKFEREDKEARKKLKNEPMPVGQLWTSKLTPKDKDVALSNDKLRLVKVSANDKELELAVFTLALERSTKREFQLVVYGQGSQPAFRLPLTMDKAKGAASVTMSPRKTGEASGVLELALLGRFKAEIPVVKQPE